MLIPTGTAGHRPLSRSAANRCAIASAPSLLKPSRLISACCSRQSKNARLGVSRLRFCSHGPNLDKTESERCPRRKSNTVFVQPSRKSNRVWEVETKERFWFRRSAERILSARNARSKCDALPKQSDSEMMRGLSIQRKQQRPNE